MNTPTKSIAFDSSRAWDDAMVLMRGNRDLLLALAGAFVVLPAFALSIFFPPPQPITGADPAAVMATMAEYYQHAAPALIVSALFHTAGMLAMLALFTDPARPTVGEAIRQGIARMPVVIAAQILIGTAVGAMLLMPILLGGQINSPGLIVIGVVAALGLGVWALVRLSLLAPAALIERLGNPIEALRRSWQLTEGVTLALLAFYFLLIVVFMISMMLIGGAVQALFASFLGAGPALLASTFAAVCVQSAMTVCMTAISAACYRQLAERS